ncbi:MAG: hypothetical protein LC667_16165 [Thioalkalivibrio sp.]|nr:hypothetical protein [Thioalkalivibrio sp.]
MTGACATFTLPAFLHPDNDGCPVYDLASLANDEQPEPLAKVVVAGAPSGAFVVQLERPTLERMGNSEFAAGAWVVFKPTHQDDFMVDNKDNTPRLLVSKAGGFNATNDRWTFGRLRLRKDKVQVLYLSDVAPRSETPRAKDVKVLGKAFGVFVNGALQKIGEA